MKIAVCLNRIQARDGTSHFAVALAEMLRELGHEVTLIATASSTEMRNALRIPFISMGQPWWQSRAGNLQRLSQIFGSNRFDIAFICLGLPAGMMDLMLHRLPDETVLVPVIGTDMPFVYDPLVRSADTWNVAVAESPRLLHALQLRLPGKPAFLLSTGVKHPSADALRERLNPAEPVRLLCVGRLAPETNVLQLPDILNACLHRNLNVTLSICGEGPESEALKQACSRLNIQDRVEFLDLPEQAGLYQAYRQHHILLFPSGFCEGLGLVLLESQANGCVPIASRLPGVTDFTLEEGITGLLASPGDIEGFAEHINHLANPAHWQAFSRAGLARTQQRFTFQAMAQEYGQLLSEIAQGRYPLPTPRAQLRGPRQGLGAFVPKCAYPLLVLARRYFARLFN